MPLKYDGKVLATLSFYSDSYLNYVNVVFALIFCFKIIGFCCKGKAYL